MSDLKIAYTVPEAAAATGLSCSSIRNALRAGILTAREAPRGMLIERDDLVKFIAALPAIKRLAPPSTPLRPADQQMQVGPP